MDIDDIEAVAAGHLFDHLSVPVTVTHPGELSRVGRVTISRDINTLGPDGQFYEAISIIELPVTELGEGQRGTLVDTGKKNDRWKLLEPVSDDLNISRWTAARHGH